MASTIFDIIPEELESSANKIEGKTSEFNRAYKSISTSASDLRVSYKGESSDTFNKKIENYQNTFMKAEKTLTDYVGFLRDYATKMKNTENELKNKANALSNG